MDAGLASRDGIVVIVNTKRCGYQGRCFVLILVPSRLLSTMNNGPVRYGNAYSPYPYGNPDNNANLSTTSISSLASTSSKVLGIFKSKNKDRPPPVPEKDYPYIGGRNALPSTSSVSITLSDAGTTASSNYSSATGKARERAAGLFKIGKKSKKNAERDLQAQQATISGPWNVKVSPSPYNAKQG
jgi:hypothetical protein